MKRKPSDVHPETTTLLAYLDAELPRTTMRLTKQHLEKCWKCRADLAEVEHLIQTISKLLSSRGGSDIARTEVAKSKFLQSKSRFEEQTKRSMSRLTNLLDSQQICGLMLTWFEQPSFKIA